MIDNAPDDAIGQLAVRSSTANPEVRCLLKQDTTELRSLRKDLAAFQQPDVVRSVAEIVASAGPLAAIWALAWMAVYAGLWWLALLLSIPAAAFIVRLFTIQHDCGHRSMFRAGPFNDWIGRAIGVITLTPYDCWRREHAIHHATSGNLDRRGVGSLVTLTVEEYRALNPLGRLGYRLYRSPLVLFLIGPIYVFFVQQRLPLGLMREGWRPWVSAMGTNIALAMLVALIICLGGWKGLLLVHLPTMVIAASIGVWLFFIQHQFEHTHWERQDAWNMTESALHGSSHYDLPAPLRWLTGNIGIHHVHHVASRIPFYRLTTVLKHYPHLHQIGRITLLQSLGCVGLTLWDETQLRLVSFGQFRAGTTCRPAP
jgi:omega-6 fatty acid desaturase (delta-12 desaturase)